MSKIDYDRSLDKMDDKHTGEPTVNEVGEYRDYATTAEAGEVDEAYLGLSRFKRFWRSVLFQMILLGMMSFAGPALNDAITNLGGGGLGTPFLANLANSLNYVGSCLVTIFGGPLINKIGIKWACVIACFGYPLSNSAYYCTSRYGTGSWAQYYLLVSTLISGVTGGFLYVAETTAMLSYPRPQDRGLYLGIWSAMRNSGSVIGGAINFSVNHAASTAGGVAQSTYLIFIGLCTTCFIWANALTQTPNVRRKDGTPVPSTGKLAWGAEFKALAQHLKHPRTLLFFLPAFYSFFYGGVMGTYLSYHFSVRARALSTLLMPCVVIIMVLFYGKFVLDNRRFSQRQTAAIAVAFWIIPQLAGFIWTGMEYRKYGKARVALDYKLDAGQWAVAYLPYLIVFSTGYWCQLSIYWILSTFSSDVKSSSRTAGLFRCFETMGQAISYGINSQKKDIRVPFYVNCALFALTVPCVAALIRLIPTAPSTVDDVADVQQEAAIKGATDVA